jgi:hypothetical protein
MRESSPTRASEGGAGLGTERRPSPGEHRAHDAGNGGGGSGPGRRSKALEARLFERHGGQPSRRSERGRSGGQGRAVNAPARKSRCGDAGPSCRRGSKLRRAGLHRGEARLTTRGNAVNPRIGSGMQQARKVEEEQTVEVVRDHAGGTRTRLVAPSRRHGSNAGPGVDSSTAPMEGRSLDNPRRGSPAEMSGGTDRAARRERRRQGHEGRARTSSQVSARPGRRSLEGHAACASGSRRSRRAVVRTNQPRRRLGARPRGRVRP